MEHVDQVPDDWPDPEMLELGAGWLIFGFLIGLLLGGSGCRA